MQLLDSAFPVGAFSHSFGLETLVQNGSIKNAQDLREYAQTMLFGAWSSCDALAAKAVYDYVPQQQWDELWEVDTALHLQRVAKEAREGLHKMGKRLLRLARTLYPFLEWEPLLEAIAARQCFGTHPLVYGWTTYHLGVSLEQAVEGYLYSCLSACINNAVRLMALGQTEAQMLLSQLFPQVHEAWLGVADQSPLDFYTATPAADIAMMQHETLYSRLFMS